MEAKDLTHSAFDWLTYVCRHQDADTIVGVGVVRFELRFLLTQEPNGQKLLGALGPWAFRRCDFIVHRADGTHVRMHPDRGKEAKVVTGSLNDWNTAARASTPGDTRVVQPKAGHFSRHAPTDIIGQASARVVIDEILRRVRPRRGEMIDLTDGQEFDWERFLMGREWGVVLLVDGVRSFHAGRDGHGHVDLEN